MSTKTDKRELIKLADIIRTNDEPIKTSFYNELKCLFINFDKILIHDYGTIKEQEAEIVFAGPRFANVVLPNGATVSLNYGSIVSFGSNKDDGACSISFFK